MNTRYELKDVDEILNIEGFFGGDQQWFEDILNSNYLTKKGCSVIAMTNYFIYIANTKREYAKLVPENLLGKRITKTEYIKFADMLSTFLKPKIYGVPFLFPMNNGIRKYAKKNGMSLVAQNYNFTWKIRNIVTYIIGAIANGYPVLMLTLNHKNPDVKFHWVTITSIYYDDSWKIECSNWGTKRVYDLEKWFKEKSLYKGLIYYQ